eukprot:CAMPEP_0170971696 /NCGR_PEP_ID=MMETSP0735-20130129/45449_1 /TAXON_ID=186038 /ORGANISM="Fragilariopsis kerguelensis, Strain L26-C5" /LENGTH=90 /DNA_ID=CAMNT_0011391849 /DNA_START=87 /DNA_END=359 /DNA_ORIENTATION=+
MPKFDVQYPCDSNGIPNLSTDNTCRVQCIGSKIVHTKQMITSTDVMAQMFNTVLLTVIVIRCICAALLNSRWTRRIFAKSVPNVIENPIE